MRDCNEVKLITRKAVAELLSISERGVARAVARKDIPEPKKIGRSSRWVLKELMEKLGLEAKHGDS